jgi:membrane protease YdiL (CAAX protease family)
MHYRQSALNLVRVLVPLWLFYALLYAFLVQPFFAEATHGFLIWGKLILPPLVLGIVSYAVYMRTQPASVPRLWISPSQVEWPAVVFAIACGIWLSFLPYAATRYLHVLGATAPMLYYGTWSLYDPLFLLANLLLLGSNFAEELYFRGLLFPYLKGKTNILFANILVALIFTIAHFPPTISIVVVLIALALVAALLVQVYDTLFYAFIAHSILNLVSFLTVTTQLGFLMRGSPLAFGIEFFLASVALALALAVVLYRKRSTSVADGLEQGLVV